MLDDQVPDDLHEAEPAGWQMEIGKGLRADVGSRGGVDVQMRRSIWVAVCSDLSRLLVVAKDPIGTIGIWRALIGKGEAVGDDVLNVKVDAQSNHEGKAVAERYRARAAMALLGQVGDDRVRRSGRPPEGLQTGAADRPVDEQIQLIAQDTEPVRRQVNGSRGARSSVAVAEEAG